MKKTMLFLTVVVVAVMMPVAGAEQAKDPGWIPTQDVFGGKLKITGFGQWQTVDSGTQWEDDWSNLRFRVSYQKGNFGGSVVINFADIERHDGNWLREAWGSYQVTDGARPGDGLQLRFGRLFSAGGYTQPGPFDQETVAGPNADPFECYATGLQLVFKNEKWLAVTEFTGNSGVPFDSDANWDTWGFAGHIQRNFNSGWIATTIQLTGEKYKFGTDFGFKPVESLTMRGGICYLREVDDKTSDKFGMYLFAGYRPIKFWELHAMADYSQNLSKSWVEYQTTKADDGTISINRVQCESDGSNNTALTVGMRVFVGKDDLLSLTADCRIPLDESRKKDPELLLRAQLKF